MMNSHFFNSRLSHQIWIGITAVVVAILAIGAVIFVRQAGAAAATVAADATSGYFGQLRLKASSASRDVVRITVGSNENSKTLTAVTVAFAGTSGSPTWTNGAATSSNLADLAASGTSGISLWKESSGLGFNSATDTRVTLAASPVYGASNAFTMTPATPPTLATDDVYYVVIQTKASPTNNDAFTLTLPANGIVTSGSSPTITAVTTQPITIDTSVPTISTSFPTSGATNVPISTVPRVTFSENIDPQTINSTNITFTSSGSSVGANFSGFPDGFEVVVSSPPTFAASSRFAKKTSVAEGFFRISGSGTSILPDGVYQTPVVGDIVYFQHETFPPEVGVVTDATLTSGTFAINNFIMFGSKEISKFATPAATGAVSSSTTLTTGDIIVVNTTANPTDMRYNWRLVTTGAAVNSTDLRLDGSSSAPTYVSGSQFSKITPTATATDNGATASGTLAVSLGDLVFAKVGSGSYGWHLATTAGNLSSDATEGTAGLDGETASNSRVASGSQMSKITPNAQGDLTDTTTSFAVGDFVFAKTTANAANNGSYVFHLVTDDAASISNSMLRLDHSAGSLSTSVSYILTVGTGVTDRAGNALASSTAITFTTGSTGTTNTTPPFVTSSSPSAGNLGFPPNAPINVQFSVPMAITGDGSVLTSTNVGIYTDNFGALGTIVSASNLYNSTARRVDITPAAALSASTNYILKVAVTTTSETGTAIASEFRVPFRTSSSSDSAKPTVLGVFPTGSSVTRSLGAISVGFSEDMLSSTINNLTLTISPTVAGSVSYDSRTRTATFSPSAMLAASTTYTVTVTSSATDLAGNPLDADSSTVGNQSYTATFVTGSASDATQPTVMSANADNFGVAITFSEPMKSGGGPNAADNIVNYSLESPVGASISLGGRTVVYDGTTMTARISGLALQNGNTFKVTVGTLTQDLAGLGIDTTGTPAGNIAQGTVANATTTGGQLGPGSGPAQTAGEMGMNPTRVTPLNRVAGATSNYSAEFLAATSIPLGGSIVLTFPIGFNVAGAVAATAGTESRRNSDLNGPMTGTVTIASVTANATARTITIVTAGAATGANAFISLDLKTIINSTVPSSTGYTVDIKTRDASNVILETKTSAAFFLGASGSSTLTVNVFNDNGAGANAGNGTKDGDESGIQNANVRLFNPATGELTGVTNASGVATFSSLSDGSNYMIMVDPSSVASGGYAFNSAPQPLTISGATIKNFGLRAAPYTISGTISGITSTSVDVFAMSSTGFTRTTVNTGAGGSVAYSLPASANTTYRVGVGPAMPDSSLSMGGAGGPPPTFTFMPPPQQEVGVTSANRTSINFTLTAATSFITGVVRDSASTGISGAMVFARPMASTTGGAASGFGTAGQTDTSGNFTLNVIPGVYLVGASKPGMPPTGDLQITVPTTGTNTPATLTFIMSASSSGLTISGSVTDTESNAIPYAGIAARRVTSTTNTTAIGGGGSNFVNSNTDSNGSYTLYISAGTWVVEAFAPGFGRLGSRTVTVGTSSVTGQDFSASTLSLGTVSGSATRGGAAQQGVMVRAQNTAGENMAITDSSGSYSMRLPAGTYTIYCFFPGVGDATPLTGIAVTANATTSSGTTCSVGTPITITVNLTDGTNPISGAFVDVRDSSGRGNGTGVSTTSGANAVYVVSVPPGTYTVRAGSPAFGTIGTTSSVSTTQAITYTATGGRIYAVSGSVTGDGSALSSAWVSLTGTPTGQTNMIHVGGQSNSSGAFSINVPNGSYSLRADKPGYTSPAPTTVTVSGATAAGIIALTTAARTIAGTVTLSSSGVSNAFVDATNGTGGYAVAQTDSTGAFSLAVNSGTWTLRAHSMGYEGGPLPVVVTTANITGVSLALSAISGFTVYEENTETITPTSGGFISDSNIGTNFRVNIPANALGTSSNASTVRTQLNTALPNPPTGAILSRSAVTISATDASGQSISTLNDDVTITVPYNESELPSGASESSLVLGVWNDATQNYDTLSTIVDTTANTLTATVDHFSDFAPLVPTDSSAPSTPAGFAANNIGSGLVYLSWGSVTGASSYYIYRSTDNSIFPYYATTVSTNYNVSGQTPGVAVYFKVSAANTSGNESAATSAVSIVPTSTSNTAPGGSGGSPQVVTSVLLLSPNGGGTLTRGAAANILWSSSGSGISTIRLSLSSNGGINFSTVIATGESNDGTYSWTIPTTLEGTAFRVKIEGLNSSGVLVISDISDANFAISAAAAVTPTSPTTTTPTQTDTSSLRPTSIPVPTRITAPVTVPGLSVRGSVTLVNGDKIRAPGSNTVYLYTADGKRHAFFNEVQYRSWFPNFSGVREIPVDQMAAVALGKNMKVHSGTYLIKIQSNPKVYAVEPGGIIRWIETEAVAQALYGNGWAQRVIDVDVTRFVDYYEGTSINTNTYANGSVLTDATGSYYVQGGQRRTFATSELFSEMGYQNRFINLVTDATIHPTASETDLNITVSGSLFGIDGLELTPP